MIIMLKLDINSIEINYIEIKISHETADNKNVICCFAYLTRQQLLSKIYFPMLYCSNEIIYDHCTESSIIVKKQSQKNNHKK